MGVNWLRETPRAPRRYPQHWGARFQELEGSGLPGHAGEGGWLDGAGEKVMRWRGGSGTSADSRARPRAFSSGRASGLRVSHQDDNQPATTKRGGAEQANEPVNRHALQAQDELWRVPGAGLRPSNPCSTRPSLSSSARTGPKLTAEVKTQERTVNAWEVRIDSVRQNPAPLDQPVATDSRRLVSACATGGDPQTYRHMAAKIARRSSSLPRTRWLLPSPLRFAKPGGSRSATLSRK